MLAYSASSDEADELRRLSILGRAGPPEHLQWIGQWGIFDALRAGRDVVRVDERPELGLRPRLAVGIHRPAADSAARPAFAGTIWVQQGSRPLADDAEEVLRGAAVLAARIMARLAATPSTHARAGSATARVWRDGDVDEPPRIARELGIVADGAGGRDRVPTAPRAHPGSSDVLALSASAFHRDAQVATDGARVYVLFPQTGSAVGGDVLGARHRRRAAHRTGPGTAGGGRRPGGRARAGRRSRAPRWTGCSTAPAATPARCVR